MKNFKIKSYCKINLSLKVLKKLNNGYHSIESLITFCELHDVLLISKIRGLDDKVSFSGRFNKGIDKKSNTITKVLQLLRKNKLIKNIYFRINVKKKHTTRLRFRWRFIKCCQFIELFKLKNKIKIE